MYPNNATILYARFLAEANELADPHKMSAVFYKKNRIVAVGINQPYKTHPKAPTPYKTRHAEFNALMDLRKKVKKEDLSEYSIYVHRVRRNGSDGIARPCFCCQTMLEWAGISKIYWSL